MSPSQITCLNPKSSAFLFMLALEGLDLLLALSLQKVTLYCDFCIAWLSKGSPHWWQHRSWFSQKVGWEYPKYCSSIFPHLQIPKTKCSEYIWLICLLKSIRSWTSLSFYHFRGFSFLLLVLLGFPWIENNFNPICNAS